MQRNSKHSELTKLAQRQAALESWARRKPGLRKRGREPGEDWDSEQQRAARLETQKLRRAKILAVKDMLGL